MQISYQWLRKHIVIEKSPEEIGHLLTQCGLEVEKIIPFESIKGGLDGLVIGHVLTCEKHPGADKLSKTTVSIGNGVVVPIVCGAPNVAAGQKVIVATVGATLYPIDGESFKINKAKIRGEVSEGMICAEDEIGLGRSHDGIMVLDTELPEGTPASVYFDIVTDSIFEIGLTPNRADAASHLGVARDLSVLLDQPLVKFNEAYFAIDSQTENVEVVIENTTACPRYCGVVLTGLTVSPSPDWLKNALNSIGITPINNLVDATNYILHDMGQPLHAFDLDQIEGRKIVVKNVAKDTPFVTLDSTSRKLAEFDLTISDAAKPMCIAGVFGGKTSGVSNNTTAIFLESAYFSADSVRKTSLHHGLKTDASFRFERGTDPDMPMKALKKAALLIKEIAGGQISSAPIDIYPSPALPFEVNTSYDRINKLIGKKIDPVFVNKTLEGLEIKVQASAEGKLSLLVPPYRVDVKREADITEEVLRMYGYDNIELNPHLQAGYVAAFAENNGDKIQKIISDLLVGLGYSEIITNSLTKSSYAQFLKMSDTDVKILNPLSETLDVMRQSLVFSGLEVVLHNINRRQKDLKLYEFGKTYHLIEGKYIERKKIALYLTGQALAESWKDKSKEATFHDLKGVVGSILSKLGIAKFDTSVLENTFWNYGMQITARQKPLVSLGLLSKDILKYADIKQPVLYAEFDLELLEKLYSNKVVYQELSKFPEVRRDLSLVIDRQVTFDQIKNLAHKQEKQLIKEINVFDVYEGDKIADSKKAYAVSFMLQHPTQTLTDEVIDKTMKKLIYVFEKELGAVIRR